MEPLRLIGRFTRTLPRAFYTLIVQSVEAPLDLSTSRSHNTGIPQDVQSHTGHLLRILKGPLTD